MYLTKEQYEIALDGYAFIDKAVKEFGEEYEKEFCKGQCWINKIEFDPETETIDIEEEYSYCGCCSNDYENVYLPISYLWDDNWVGREKEKRDQDAHDREKRKEEEKAAREKAREEERYQKFLKMKEEYEPLEVKKLELNDED